MKFSMAALSFLILAVAPGSRAQIVYDTEIRERQRTMDLREPLIYRDCCLSYTPRRIQCKLMEDYFETSSGCTQPAIIFVTKKGKRVCADPKNLSVQNCIRKLKPGTGFLA
ncbi:C-C motif chemokine 23-like isoform X2 [Octodon degus]|uniref:C-C motif chemokine n=1 Tax=Octodon degus TaxID=10160 RepID=A0A6P6DFS2_OCTDE|nr:C-C motif chemokine 23-like isoform X2 [Octodon degus]